MAGVVFRIRVRHVAVRRARGIGERGAERCVPINATVHVCNMCPFHSSRPVWAYEVQMPEACRDHSRSGTIESTKLPCGAPPRYIGNCSDLKRLRRRGMAHRHGAQGFRRS